MASNGRRAPRKPRLEIQAPGASAEEAAAITAAIEQFIADTAPAPRESAPSSSLWQRAALAEGVRRAELRRFGWC